MSFAISVVKTGGIGLRATAKLHGIPTTTLKDHVDGKNKYAIGEIKYFGRPTTLPANLENELVQHILDSESMFFGLTGTAVMALAYEIASRNGISHVGLFSQEKKTAGKVWLKLFLQRHPEVSLRQPEATSIARATGFNRSSVDRFYNLLGREIDRHRFTGMTIYNMDETAVSKVQKKCQKVAEESTKLEP